MWATAKYSATWGHTSVAGDVLASRKAHGHRAHEPGWHRENYSSPAEGSFPSAGDFLYGFERTGGTENELYTAAFRSTSDRFRKKYDVVPISCEICALMPGRLQSAA